jgi:hypothetical protein
MDFKNLYCLTGSFSSNGKSPPLFLQFTLLKCILKILICYRLMEGHILFPIEPALPSRLPLILSSNYWNERWNGCDHNRFRKGHNQLLRKNSRHRQIAVCNLIQMNHDDG